MDLTKKIQDLEQRLRVLESQNEFYQWYHRTCVEDMWEVCSTYRNNHTRATKNDLYNALGIMCGLLAYRREKYKND